MTARPTKYLLVIVIGFSSSLSAFAGSAIMSVPSGPGYSARFIVSFDLKGQMIGCKLNGIYDHLDAVKPLAIVPPETFNADAFRQVDPHWTKNPRKIVAGEIVCEYFESRREVAFCSHRFAE